jgi:hypothetical protein
MIFTHSLRKLCLLFSLLLIGAKGLYSQNTITIGNMSTNSISEKYPFDDYYNYSWSNVIYLNTEIGQAGQINQIAFYVYQGPSNLTMTNQKILMRHTTASSYSVGTYPGETGFTTVFNGSITYNQNGGNGWQVITLSTPFAYNGTSNLEVLFENNNGSYSISNFPYFYVTTGYSVNRARRDYYDNSFPSTCQNCGAFANVPNTQLIIGCSTTMTVSPTSASICNGNSTTLTASGVSSYTWAPTTGLNSSTTASVTANPTTTTVYTITGKDANNCTQIKTTTVTVNALPTIAISPSAPALCIGSSATVTASGATNYTWSPSTGLNTTTSATVMANPTVTTTYTLTGKDANNCVSTKAVTLTVNALPTIATTPTAPTICAGSNANITASGASTYAWNPSTGLSASTGSTVTATSTVTSNYTVTGTDANGCINTKLFTVTVNSLPTVTVAATNTAICNGSSSTLTSGGASIYSWAPTTGLSATTGTNVTASPTVTTTYSVTGTSATGCAATKTISITVNAAPSLTLNPSSPSICIGNTTIITASGASTYTWSPSTGLSSTTTASVSANSTITTTYSLNATGSSGCVSSKVFTLTVNALPTIAITPTAPTICVGSNTNITASGASTYAWNPSTGLSASTGSTVTATSTVTSNYTITGTDANGCVNTKSFTVSVNSLPTVTVVATNTAICNGSSTTLTAGGASTYSWTPTSGLSATTGTNVIASPTVTTTYSVTGTSATGCTATKTISITVNAVPSLTLNPTSATICAGSTTTLTVSGANTYTWSTGATTTTLAATPSITTTYSVNATGSNGCAAAATVVVTVNSDPTISVSPGSVTACNGTTTTLTASGGTSYTWSPTVGLNTSTGATVIANPGNTTTYTVTGSNSNSCGGTASVTINVSYVNAGSALATGGTVTCNNNQVALSLSNNGVTTIGNGTNSSEKYPFDGYYNYSWSDVIYLQSEIGAAGTLSALSFSVNNVPNNFVMTTQQIYIRTTTATSFTNSTYPTTSGFTQAYNGTITYNGSGWKTITLSTPFTYDGTSNLEILYENHDGSWGNGFPTFNYTSGYSSNRLKRDYQDASFPSSCNTCGAYAYVPNTQFTISRTLGTFVKWQSSTDNINYSDVSGGTTQSLNTNANTSTYYRAQVTNGSCQAYSNPAYYITNNNYYVNDNSSSGDLFSTAVGNSSNDGRTPSRPQSSINYIFNHYTLGPCDTVFVDKGSYTEEVDIYYPQGGNSTGNTTVHGAGIGKTILNAPNGGDNFYLFQPDYIKIEGFTMNSTQSYASVEMYEATHNVLTNNKITNSASTNLIIYGDNLNANKNAITNNTFVNSSTSGRGIIIQGNADSLTIQNDSITMSNASSQDAILVTTYSANSNAYYPSTTTINQNIISAYSYGVSLYGYDYAISTFTITNNKITMLAKTASDGGAIWLEGVGSSSTDQTLIYNNRLIGGTNGMYFGTSADYLKIYNNYVSGSDYGVYVASNSSDVNELYFNSFYNNITNLYFASSANSYWKVKDNILYTTNSTNTNACISVGSNVTFSACNYNLFYNPNGASIARFNSTNYATLAAWQAKDHADETTNGDENSKSGNPLYSNASTNNLDLTGNSPADIAGTTIIGITTDIYAHTRFSPPNIGAEEEIPIASTSGDTSICFGSSIQLQAAGGLNYSWAPVTGLNDPSIANPIASPTLTTQYTVTVTDGGESTTTKITVTVKPIPQTTVNKASICLGNSATLIASMASTYTWSPSIGLNSTSGATVTATPTATTIYTVTGSTAGCSLTTTTSVKVFSNNVSVQISNLDSLMNGDTLSYIVSSTNVSYTVNPAVDQSFCIPLSTNDTGLVPVKIIFIGKNTGDTTVLFYYLNTSNQPISISTISKNHSTGRTDTLALDSTNYNLRLGSGSTNISFSTSFLNMLFASSQVYANLSRALDASYFIVRNGSLLFRYDEEYADKDQLLTYTVYDTYHNLVSSSKNNTAKPYPVYLGDNRYNMNMSSCNFTNHGPLGSGTYLLIVENEKKEKWYLRVQNNVTSSPNCPQLNGGGNNTH